MATETGNLRVAVFSDSHVGTTFHGEGFARHMKEIEAQKESGVDLVLSGYTHGGQLFPLINIE